MNKQKWTEKPVTWGGYLKLSGIVTVIGRDFQRGVYHCHV